MFSFFRKHKKFVFIFLCICAVAMVFFGVGTSSMGTSANDVILTVNGEKIRQRHYDQILKQIIRQRPPTSEEERFQLENQTLQEVIRQEVFNQESEKFGIQITDQDLQLDLASIPAFQKEGKFDPATYVQSVRQIFGLSLKDFETIQKKDSAARRLNRLLFSSIHVTDSEAAEELANRLKTEKDPKKIKELKDNPHQVKEQIRNQEFNLVYGDWLNQLNSSLKVNFVSDTFKKRLQPPTPPQPSAPTAPPAQ
ncbi:MAG: SurA N-terminal domain-containing protein [Elusimicrobiota bacterium]